MLDLTDCNADMWPSVRASIEFSGVLTAEATAKKGGFCRELCRLFDRLQEAFARLEAMEKARCGLDGVAAEIFLQIDLEKRKIVLDTVPALQGYELAREIRRFLGVPEVECVFLKGDTGERLLMGDALQGLSFEGILVDTQRHYLERGGVEKKRQELGPGRELSMYWRGRKAKKRSCGCR